MYINFKTIAVLIVIVSIGFSRNSTAEQKGGPIYTLTKQALSSAGGHMSGGAYAVTTSVAQIDAKHNASGGAYQFSGGILARVNTIDNDVIFKNSFEVQI